jgi:light-regulated signal transduction histidine kinase (bacteriophytochrome)
MAENDDSPEGQVDLNVVVTKSLDNLKQLITDTHAEVTHDTLPVVTGYETMLVSLLQNLLGNAMYYRSEAPPQIHIGAERTKDEWRIAVTDNGIGIDPKYHEQIFQVFKRLHGSDRPGTGVGLAICRRVVERHGGRIWVESQLGQGSTFYFTLKASLGKPERRETKAVSDPS